MDNYKLKRWIKPLYSMGIKCWVPFYLLFVSQKVQVSTKKAQKILETFSSDSHGTVDATNQITPDYDLHIIIPCYNVEKYIEECLKSVFSQKTQFSFFITIVNDGSTDSTLFHIRHVLAQQSDLFRRHVELIDQPNKGFSGARNTALQHIRGRYIMFVDSDDMLLPLAIESLLSSAYETQASIIEGGYTTIDTQGCIISTHYSYPHVHFGQPWAKLYKSECFANLKFPEGYLFEDSIMACCLFSQYKVLSSPSIVYQYRLNPTSITRTHKALKKSTDVFYLFPYLWNWMQQHGLMDNPASIKTILNQTALAYQRTTLHPLQIQEAGFCLLSDFYKKMEGWKKEKSLSWKYRKMIDVLCQRDFGKYTWLSRYWRFL